MKKIKFTEQEKQNIKEAVRKVEKTTSGEIVTFFVKKSDNYNGTVAWASLFASILFLIIINALSYFWLLPFKFNILNYSIFQIVLMGLTFISVSFIPFIKRVLISSKKKEEAVHKKATEAFINEEVFNTKDRTGILIFISEFEHRVKIIADSGINQKIEDKEHKELVDTIVSGIKKNKTAEGIITAIHLYGNLLLKNGYSIKPNDTNELKNDIIIEE
ncbi:MAG: hypothetical protein L3J35_09745 [Bacteroidales bacterium]|nr:hypothetical protein [Bacteroidales bacterium]